MREKGFAPLVILIFLAGAGLLAYFGFFYKAPIKNVPRETTNNIESTPLPSAPATVSPSLTPSPTTVSTPKPIVKRSGAHYYLKPEIPIDNIALTIVYYIPKGQSPDSNWLSGLNQNASALKNFFERELGHKVKISYYVYTQPIIATLDYNLDIPNTGSEYTDGCTQALNNAMSEIKPKVKAKYTGDLNLWAVVFEGLNCSMGPGNSLIVPGYIIDHFTTAGNELLAGKLISHEFGHLLGLPDSYSDPLSMMHNGKQESYYSIMGHGQGDGQWHSLNDEFISDINKERLGI